MFLLPGQHVTIPNGTRNTDRQYCSVVAVRRPGKRKKPDDVIICEALVQGLRTAFDHFFPRMNHRRHFSEDRNLREFVRYLRKDEGLEVLAEGGQRELNDLDEALEKLDQYKTEGRHYSFEDFMAELSAALGGAVFKPGVGLLVPEEKHGLSCVEVKRTYIDEAYQSIESIDKPDGEDTRKNGGARGMTWTDLFRRLTRGPQGAEYKRTCYDDSNKTPSNGWRRTEHVDQAMDVDESADASTAKIRKTDDDIAEVERQLAEIKMERQASAEKRMEAVVAEPQDSFLRKGPLSPEQEEEVDEVFEDGYGGDILVRAFNADLTRQQLRCLLPYTWLNDEVVNTYMKLLDARDKELCSKDPSRRPSHFFPSFFVTKLLENGKYNYRGVRRWTKKIKAFEMDKLFCPVNVSNMHWCMAVIYMQEKRVQYYDSMGGSGSRTTNALMKWLDDEDDDKLGDQGTFDSDEWTVAGPDIATTPQQNNGSDCGVFAVSYASFASDNLPFNFSQDDIVQMRRRMLWSLVNQKLV